MSQDKEGIKVRVAERQETYYNQFFCPIDPEIMDKFGLKRGIIVQVKGKKSTAGILIPSSDDTGKGIIRLDETQRLNAGCNMGEYIEIKLVEVSNAKDVLLFPTEEDIDLKNQVIDLRQYLIDRPLVIGDIVNYSGNIYRKRAESNSTQEIMSMFITRPKSIPVPGHLKLIIEKVNPYGLIMHITRRTRIRIGKKVAYLNSLGNRISFDDVGGLNDEIQKLREIINFPLNNIELIKKLNIVPPKGILLFGPTGTGKTLLVKALSQEVDAHFIYVNAPDILSRYMGGAEKKLQNIFEEAKKNAPAIIFFNKVEVIAPKEGKAIQSYERGILGKLLELMDDIEKKHEIIVIAETNKLDVIDPTLRRPGRFDFELEIGFPDFDGRYDILLIHTRGKKLNEDVNLKHIAEKTEGFVGADLEFLVKEASVNAIKSLSNLANGLESIELKMQNFLAALKVAKPASQRE